MRRVSAFARAALVPAMAGMLAGLLATLPGIARAGAQAEEALASGVQTSLHRTVSDYPAPRLVFANDVEGWAWLADMSSRLASKIPDAQVRRDFLITVQYEASRAGLDPQLVLALIQHESNFRKYAVSSASARGYMQVMPFWVRLIGNSDHDLFNLRTNLRYGCTILRFYLDRESGDLYRALGRYNGSLGQPDYPNAILSAWRRSWTWSASSTGGAMEAARFDARPALR
jgi:soluble lytic murein transglycosylase-like protein